MVPLKYLSNFPKYNFWRTLEISLQLKWSKSCILVAGTKTNENTKFQRNDTKLYVPVVTLSTQENIKHIKQLESGLKEQWIGINI